MISFTERRRFWYPVVLLAVILVFASDRFVTIGQESPPSETPVETALPISTEAPTDTVEPSLTVSPTAIIPTETTTPSDSSTPVITEIPVSPIPTITAEIIDPSVTISPTGEVVPSATSTEAFPSEPALELLSSVNFNGGEFPFWSLDAGWSFVQSEGGQALQTASVGTLLSPLDKDFLNVAVQSRFKATDAEVQFTLRKSIAGQYTVRLNTTGEVEIYRGDTLFKSVILAPITDGNWHTLRFSTVDGILRVSVDGTEIVATRDESYLPPGDINIVANGLNGGSILLDDVNVWVSPEEIPIHATAISVPSATSTPIITPTVQSDKSTFSLGQQIKLIGMLSVVRYVRPNTTMQASEQIYLSGVGAEQTIELVMDKTTARQLNGHQVEITGQVVALVPSTTVGLDQAILHLVTIHVDSIKPTNTALSTSLNSDLSAQSVSYPWATILCRYADSINDSPHSPSWYSTLMGSGYPGMANYWNQVSNNTINLNGSAVFGWYNLPQPKSYYTNISGGMDLGKIANDCTSVADTDIYFPAFTGINLWVNQDISIYSTVGYWGFNLDGQSKTYSTLWMGPGGYNYNSFVAMMMGYGLGLSHTGGALGSDGLQSNWDIMSGGGMCRNPDVNYSCVGVGPVAYQRDVLGWIPNAQKFIAPAGARSIITLDRLNQPISNTNYLIARIPIDNTGLHFYTVEARMFNGYDINVPGEAVVIHQVDLNRSPQVLVVDTDGNGDPNDAGAMWTIGETFSDLTNGIWVSVLDGDVTSFTVQITRSTSSVPIQSSLLLPSNGSVTNNPTPNFSWSAIFNGITYQLQVDNNSTFLSPEINTTTDQRNYTANVTLVDGIYYWRVRAINGFNAPGAWSVARSLTIDTLQPAKVILTTPANTGGANTSRPKFLWGVVVGANLYHLQVAADAGFNSVEIDTATIATTYTAISDLTNSSHFWRVQARDIAGNWGSWSNSFTFDITILRAPVNYSFTTDTTPIFQWYIVPGAINYQVQVAFDTGFNNIAFSYVSLNGITASYTVPPVNTLGYGVYYWRVNVNKGIGFELSPIFWRLTVTPIPPVAPVLLSPANSMFISDNTPDLSWSSVSNGVNYRIQIDNNPNFSSPEQDSTLSNLVYTTDILSDGMYYWRVQSLNYLDASGAWSAAKVFTIDTIAPPVPIMTAPTNGVSTINEFPVFTWGAVLGALRYEMQLDTANPPVVTVLKSTFLTFTPPSPLLLTTYYWRVRTIDAAGNSSNWSQIRSVIITSPVTGVPRLNRFTTSMPTLTWNATTWATSYEIQVDNNSNFSSPEYSSGLIGADLLSITPTVLLPNGTWYWRIRARNSAGIIGPWSSAGTFIIES